MNMQIQLFILIFSFWFSAFAKEIKLTPFQENIRTCLSSKDIPQVQEIQATQTLNQLYDLLNKHYSLRTTETISREVVYKEKNEMRKLKFEKGVVSIFKVQDDDTLKLINNDMRQKGLTDESALNQILLRADIRTDWLKVKEVRSQETLLYFGREQSQVKTLSFEKLGQKMKLECLNKESSDICICRR